MAKDGLIAPVKDRSLAEDPVRRPDDLFELPNVLLSTI